jgi:hypothetical protein
MSTISKLKLGTLLAFTEGYRVNSIGEVLNPKGKICKVNSWPKGKNISYYVFCFRGYKIQVHHLVAMQKFGVEWLLGDLLVRHKNDYSQDNSLDNIILGTKRDNYFDMPSEKREEYLKITHSKTRMFSDEEIKEIRKDKETLTYKELHNKYPKASQVTLRFICTRRLYKHVE